MQRIAEGSVELSVDLSDQNRKYKLTRKDVESCQ
jgi:hypothetical protein